MNFHMDFMHKFFTQKKDSKPKDTLKKDKAENNSESFSVMCGKEQENNARLLQCYHFNTD